VKRRIKILIVTLGPKVIFPLAEPLLNVKSFVTILPDKFKLYPLISSSLLICAFMVVALGPKPILHYTVRSPGKINLPGVCNLVATSYKFLIASTMDIYNSLIIF
jgi:hypothetical protein